MELKTIKLLPAWSLALSSKDRDRRKYLAGNRRGLVEVQNSEEWKKKCL